MPISVIQQKNINKKNASMHELNNVERGICSQEALEKLLVKLKSILDILVGLSEDPDEVSICSHIFNIFVFPF